MQTAFTRSLTHSRTSVKNRRRSRRVVPRLPRMETEKSRRNGENNKGKNERKGAPARAPQFQRPAFAQRHGGKATPVRATSSATRLGECCIAAVRREPRAPSTGRTARPRRRRPLAADWSASTSSRWAAACRAPARRCQRYDTHSIIHAMRTLHAPWRRHRGHPKRTASRPLTRLSPLRVAVPSFSSAADRREHIRHLAARSRCTR